MHHRVFMCSVKQELTGRDLAPTRGGVIAGPFSAAIAGGGVGVLGGLLGLGGAEFRLPLLVALFGYALRQAIPLNLAISFVAVVIAALSRWLLAGQAPLRSAVPVAVAMMVSGMIG